MVVRSFFLMSILTLFAVTAEAEQFSNPFNTGRIGIQSAISTGGNFGIGLEHFTENTEIGFSLSGKINNASNQTKTITPVIFGGFRKSLGEKTYFAYGLNWVNTLGRDNGIEINSSYNVAPYISLEQMLTMHVMLVGWIEPYNYGYVKKGGASTSTHTFFGSGGLGINYLF